MRMAYPSILLSLGVRKQSASSQQPAKALLHLPLRLLLLLLRLVGEMIEVQKRRSVLRYTILHELLGQPRNRQDPLAAKLDGRLDTRLLLGAAVSEQVVISPDPSPGEGGTGMAMK